MKKFFLLFVSVLVFFGFVALSIFFVDKTAPIISLISTPQLSKDCAFENLINYASVSDDNLKSFFIEDSNVANIIDSKSITYVAIDEANNISKLKTTVEIADEYLTFHLVRKKDLYVQVGSKFNINDYFELQNECGVVIDDRLKISNLNTNKIGVYDVVVESTLHKTEPLYEVAKVFDESVPEIFLKSNELKFVSNSYWSDNDFIDNIDNLVDDKDSYEDLIKNVKTNWVDVLKPGFDGYVTAVGTYDVDYTVTDSDGNVSNARVVVVLENNSDSTNEESIGG